jgi:hypothetical protein
MTVAINKGLVNHLKEKSPWMIMVKANRNIGNDTRKNKL